MVVIGRNEGERLARCLASAISMRPWPGPMEMVYVDSGSSDGSPEAATAAGVRVIRLNSNHPTAALGRNAGWRAAGNADFILFLDGDTLLDPDFPGAALAAMQANPDVAAVWGHRREINPAQSIYTRVFDLDWIYPPGNSAFCGGDVLMRRDVLESAGGYDEELIAGEEPELCRRMCAGGWRILHIDHAMTGHDLGMTSFRQYWMRSKRTGYALAKVSARFRHTQEPLWREESRNNLVRGFFWLLSPLASLPIAAALRSTWPIGLWLAGLALAAARSAWRARWKTRSLWTLALYGVHSHLQQIPILLGQLRYWLDRYRGLRRGLIEYR